MKNAQIPIIFAGLFMLARAAVPLSSFAEISDQANYLWHGCIGEPQKATEQEATILRGFPPTMLKVLDIHGNTILDGYLIDENGHVKNMFIALLGRGNGFVQDFSYLCSENAIQKVIKKLLTEKKPAQYKSPSLDKLW